MNSLFVPAVPVRAASYRGAPFATALPGQSPSSVGLPQGRRVAANMSIDATDDLMMMQELPSDCNSDGLQVESAFRLPAFAADRATNSNVSAAGAANFSDIRETLR